MFGTNFFKTALFCLASVASMAATGDLTITFKSEFKLFLKTQKSTKVHYYSEQYRRVNDESEKTDTLIDYKNLVAYQINHKKKTIGKLTMDDAVMITDAILLKLESGEGAEIKEIEKIFGLGAGENASVEKNGAEVIVGRNCDKWKISLGKNVFEISANPNLVDPAPQTAIENAHKMEGAITAMIPAIGRLMEEAAKIKGIHLKSEMHIPVGPVTIRKFAEALKIEEGAIPASVFELPKGYKEEDLGKKIMDEINKVGKKK